MLAPVRHTLVLALSLGCLACSPQKGDSGAEGGKAGSDEKKADAKKSDAKKADEKKGDTKKADTKKSDQPMGKVAETAPIPIGELLGKSTEEVEKTLGEATEKSSSRISCVRFLPDRVFFSCEEELRRYEDKTGTATGIAVDYEDGVAASIALTGLVGEGDFTPQAALALVGLELPGTSRTANPKENVTVWDYWNGEARLVIGGKQHRVQVSVIDGEWPRSKVEVLVNHPLTEDEKSRVKQAG